MVVLDTNIIIDHLRSQNQKETILEQVVEKKFSKLAICSITLQELYTGQSSCIKAEEQRLITTIKRLNVIPYSSESARLAGILTRDSQKNLSFPDAAIAAACLVNQCKLLTLNQKDFADIKNLELFQLSKS